MNRWNANQYLKFETQRTQPAIDLANRTKALSPELIVDIGCGTGNSTEILKRTFPNSEVMGIDSSSDMIEKAIANYPDILFKQCDILKLNGRYDLLFSNACLQWVPNHAKLIPDLMHNHLNDGGILAVQIPMNSEEPLFKIIRDAASDSRWGFQEEKLDYNGTLTPEEYYGILSNCSSSFQMWETTYYHNLPSHRALVEWVKGTRLRPYLAQLDLEQGTLFEEEILKRVKEHYPAIGHNEVILKFKRFFFTAVK